MLVVIKISIVYNFIEKISFHFYEFPNLFSTDPHFNLNLKMLFFYFLLIDKNHFLKNNFDQRRDNLQSGVTRYGADNLNLPGE